MFRYIGLHFVVSACGGKGHFYKLMPKLNAVKANFIVRIPRIIRDLLTTLNQKNVQNFSQLNTVLL
jgi:hypothetical protein